MSNFLFPSFALKYYALSAPFWSLDLFDMGFFDACTALPQPYHKNQDRYGLAAAEATLTHFAGLLAGLTTAEEGRNVSQFLSVIIRCWQWRLG